MKIAIVFIGLIIHVNQPWSFDNTAVLPRVPEHTAELIIPYAAVIDPDSWVDEKKQASNVRINLEGLSVKVNGARGMWCRVHRDFLDSVPPMRRISDRTCGRMRPEVRRRVANESIASFIDYRGGELAPAGYVRHTLKFPKTAAWAGERCVACSARYEATLTGTEATLVFKGEDGTHTVRVRPGVELMVQNVPATSDPNVQTADRNVQTAVSHFDHHYAIFRTDACTDKRVPEPTINTCGKKECQPSTAKLRPPTPGDDCTIVRYP